MSLESRNVDLKSISKYWMSMNAIVSILHRISGVILFLLIPFMLWLLSHSLANGPSFLSLQSSFSAPGFKFLTWLLLSAMAYHIIAGIKHFVMDMGFLESIEGSRWSSVFVMCVSVIIIVSLGVSLW
ncbi:MAG: succinate dehydrogenase, cytochrome b556 subunit [Gammaproteobacteria bacterium]|nr:succinate dehydrogenase, cytochrome b556 subunit [Gammaproteobacteria bacterium]